MNTIVAGKNSIEPDVAGLYWESRASEALGVQRKLLAQLRGQHLTLGTDYVRRENNAVAWTQAGKEKMESLLATAWREEPGLPGGKPVIPPKVVADDIPAGPPETAWMLVQRVPPQQVKLLMCVPLDRTEIVTVRVRENTLFKAGMKLEAMKCRDGYWQFRNREGGDLSTIGRLPRNPGKW